MNGVMSAETEEICLFEWCFDFEGGSVLAEKAKERKEEENEEEGVDCEENVK